LAKLGGGGAEDGCKQKSGRKGTRFKKNIHGFKKKGAMERE
jgi:hypothetical protein